MQKQTTSLLRIYRLSIILSLVTLGCTIWFGGALALVPVLILAVIEITFSFDNAVINSEVLGGLSKRWQTIFLTVGIAIAVFGARLLLPLLLVGSTTGHSLSYVFDLALHEPEHYAEALHKAYPVIASFGGVFLLMLGLKFFGEVKEVRWLKKIETPIADFNQSWWFSIGGAMLAVLAIYFILTPGKSQLAVAGLFGALAFLIIKGIGELLVHMQPAHKKGAKATGLVALTHFMYLEILDASFSFDGVIAAFAITKDVFLIAAGLGIGALFVRSMTVHLLEHQTLQSYRYLIHGAHYAITVLALMLLITLRFEIPDMITGLLGLVFIAAAFYSSRQYNARAAT